MKLVLTVIISGEALERVELEKFSRISVGRAQDCVVRLDNDAVSSYHCEIVRKDDLLRIYDLGSSNGTKLNDVKIDNHSLSHGDVISIGKFTIDVVIDGVRKISQRQDRAPTGELTLDGDQTNLAQAQIDAGTRVRGYLTFVDEREDMVLDGHFVRFGRSHDAEIRLPGLFTPRLAAILIREDYGFRLIDLSPRGNSVRVNGMRSSDVRLSNSDAIDVRNLQATFHSGARSEL